jgi:hypothetical protein
MVYKLTTTHRDSQFSPQMVLRIYVCYRLLCCVCGLISLSSGLLLWFLICGLVQVLFLSLAVNYSIAIFLLLPLH